MLAIEFYVKQIIHSTVSGWYKTKLLQHQLPEVLEELHSRALCCFRMFCQCHMTAANTTTTFHLSCTFSYLIQVGSYLCIPLIS